MKIFAVSIPRTEERHKYIKHHLSTVTRKDWEIVGIDAQDLRRNSAEDWRHNPDLRDSQVGCALSHATACRKIVEQNLPWALIVEDDIRLPNDIDNIMDQVGAKIKICEVISLYNRTMKKGKFSSKNRESIKYGDLIYPIEVRSMRTAAAYIIDFEGAKNISDFNIPVKLLADNWMRFYENGIISSIRLLYPIPCKLNPFNSTLAYDRQGGFFNNMVATLSWVPFSGILRKIRRRIILKKREKNIVVVDEISPLSE